VQNRNQQNCEQIETRLKDVKRPVGTHRNAREHTCSSATPLPTWTDRPFRLLATHSVRGVHTLKTNATIRGGVGGERVRPKEKSRFNVCRRVVIIMIVVRIYARGYKIEHVNVTTRNLILISVMDFATLPPHSHGVVSEHS